MVEAGHHPAGTEEIPVTNDSGEEVRAFLGRCHESLTQQSQGHPEPLFELWSRTDDVTVNAAIGGYQVGFDAVSDLLFAASKTQRLTAGGRRTS
jgi:hypothetical protein